MTLVTMGTELTLTPHDAVIEVGSQAVILQLEMT